MEKLKMHSPDLTAQNIDRIGALFPTVVTETLDAEGTVTRAINFDLLRQELSDHVMEGPQERYQLDWPGKREALFAANAPIAKTLRPVREESVDFDTTQNLFIEGDNLDALKLLQESYLGKVKLIYIDPPYNTGNDFVYNDDFAESNAEYLAKSGQVDDEGNRLVANTESNGRFHSDWLSMMYPRLKLARNLLSVDGLICVSIDDIEYRNLRKLMEEVFGEDNFVDTLIWKKRYGGGAKEKLFVSLHEYIIVFARSIEHLPRFEIALTEASIKRYYTQKDANYVTRGPYRTHPLEATKSMGARPNLNFPIPGPAGDIWPTRQWLWGRERALAALEAGELEFLRTRDGAFTVQTKQYLKDENGTVRRGKQFSIIDDVFTQHGTNEIIELFGSAQMFPFPKPSSLLAKLVDIAAPNQGDIVLDFFAGSSSMAHAVLATNAKDGIDRRFVMVQVAEQCEPNSEAGKLGYESIAAVSRERIRRAGQKILSNEVAPRWNRDVGFRLLRIDTSNLADVLRMPDAIKQGELDLYTDSVKPDRTGMDLLFQVLLDWGLELTMGIEIESIGGHEVFAVEDDVLIACLAETVSPEVVSAIAERQPLRAVFRDSGFATDADRINAEQIFAERSPATDVKTV